MGTVSVSATDAGPRGARRDDAKAILLGGGIASMAAAVFMIRDGDMLGRNTTVPEELRAAGGSLDGSGTPEGGYVLRGGRMLPPATHNLAFIGRVVELPQDVVFTVGYCIRSAQVAVHGLPGLQRGTPAVYQGKFDPRIVFKAFRALHDVRA